MGLKTYFAESEIDNVKFVFDAWAYKLHKSNNQLACYLSG